MCSKKELFFLVFVFIYSTFASVVFGFILHEEFGDWWSVFTVLAYPFELGFSGCGLFYEYVIRKRRS